MYAVDWSNIGRSEQIQITSAVTGAVLDTETLSNFYSGVYLQWKLSGSVVITVKTLAGADSVLSGIFFDPPSTSGSATSDLSNNSGSRAAEIAGMTRNGITVPDAQSGILAADDAGILHITSNDRQASSPGNNFVVYELLMPITQDIKRENKPIHDLG